VANIGEVRIQREVFRALLTGTPGHWGMESEFFHSRWKQGVVHKHKHPPNDQLTDK